MQKRAIAVFDFDGTLTPGDSIIRYVLYAVRCGHEPRRRLFVRMWQGLLAVCGLMSAEEGKSRSLSFLARMTRDEQAAFNRAFCKDILMPRIYPSGIRRLEAHKAEGLLVLLVSASPDAYINYLKELLPIDTVLASPTDEQGRVSISTRGQEKARRVQKWAAGQSFDVDWANSFSYGNSSNDLSVMRLTGHPICVNPSRKMRKLGAGLPVAYWDL